MAESMHTIIKNKEFTVNHQGNDLVTEISGFFEGIEDLTSLEKIKEWLEQKDEKEQLGFFHFAFDSSIIKNRAVCRPALKTYGKKEDFDKAVRDLEDRSEWHVSESKQTITKNILVDQIEATKRAKGWVPKPKAVPGSGTPKAFAKGEESALKMSIEAMQGIGMDDQTIVSALSKKFDLQKVQAVVDSLAI